MRKINSLTFSLRKANFIKETKHKDSIKYHSFLEIKWIKNNQIK